MAFLRAFVKCSSSNNRRLFLQGLQGLRKFEGTALKSSTAGTAIVEETRVGGTAPRDPLDVTFENAESAFKSKTTWELVRAYIVYTICSSDYLVENNMKVSYRTNCSCYIISLDFFLTIALKVQ